MIIIKIIIIIIHITGADRERSRVGRCGGGWVGGGDGHKDGKFRLWVAMVLGMSSMSE